jgi:hypothetical protein
LRKCSITTIRNAGVYQFEPAWMTTGLCSAKLANWADISDVALLKRLRNSEQWLRFLCIELLRENVAYRLEEGISRTIRIVDGTIVREPGKTGSQ